ncbi:MAG: hypothetical protein IPK06_03775 [Ignavibacteriae bacterium]|nr:hypothetical protein [Ignavibacteriota bacterium]
MKLKIIRLFAAIVMLFSSLVFCQTKTDKIEDQFEFAKSRIKDLRLSSYITAHAVRDLLNNETGRREALSVLRCNGITKVYIEVYRSGLAVDKKLLSEVKNYFVKNNFEVVGGIATVPGDTFGVKQEGKLGWFNWQNEKTQTDLKNVVKISAEIFDEFIVDDFLCTGDTSAESKSAKGIRTWSQYRRELLTKISEEIFVKPAKEVNPKIKMIVKFPQWYDRFHLFGYDLSTKPKIYDEVWVGTETRGQYTQRYGFVQPYEGFINYSWIKDIVKDKIGGAWFDHGDCDKNDFIEQAYQSVIAGAKEIVIFNYFDLINGHEGHHLLRNQFEQLADLAKFISENPVHGIKAYKPINSDAGGDLYIMDFMGMLGVPIIPVHEYPSNCNVIFLPTQAASDKNIAEKIKSSVNKGVKLICTAGFLSAMNNDFLYNISGIENISKANPFNSDQIIENSKEIKIEHGLDLECNLKLKEADVLLEAIHENKSIPFLTKNNYKNSEIYVLNTHTFSQEDFDKVGEVLLCPKPLGLLEIPKAWTNEIREIFNLDKDYKIDAPARISIQPFGKCNYLIHNYNNSVQQVILSFEDSSIEKLKDKLTNSTYEFVNGKFTIELAPRSRIWLTKNN